MELREVFLFVPHCIQWCIQGCLALVHSNDITFKASKISARPCATFFAAVTAASTEWWPALLPPTHPLLCHSTTNKTVESTMRVDAFVWSAGKWQALVLLAKLGKKSYGIAVVVSTGGDAVHTWC